MSMTDPVADLLTRIRNGLQAGHTTVKLPASKTKLEVVRILKEEGYLEDYEKIEEAPQGRIEIRLKYGHDGSSAISGLRRESRPGLRVYRGKDDIPRVLNGLGINIVSTSRGVMTGSACRKAGIGGEILCSVW